MSKSDFRRLQPSQRVNRRRGVFCKRASGLLNCIVGLTALVALMRVGIFDSSEKSGIGDVVSVRERATDVLPAASFPVIGSRVSVNEVAARVPESLRVIRNRVLAYELVTDVPPAASVREAAWRKVKGRRFVAAVCATDPSLRLGCAGLDDTIGTPVQTVPIRSQTEDDEAALRAVDRLEGAWQGAGYVLRVDGERAQANIDPKAPFEWRRFQVKRVWKDTVVFSLDAELFQATLSEASITLTGTTFRGELILTRS